MLLNGHHVIESDTNTITVIFLAFRVRCVTRLLSLVEKKNENFCAFREFYLESYLFL